MPYFYGVGLEAHQRGLPFMRPMQLEFPDDPSTAYLDRQYMIGSDLLVAPVFSFDGSVEYYLPAGTWTNYLTGETATGPVWRRETHDVMSIPLWVRGGAVLPTGSRTDRPDYDYVDGLLVTVYPGSSTDIATAAVSRSAASTTPSANSSTIVTSPETGAEIVVTVERTSDSVQVTTSGTTDVRVRLAGGEILTTSNGKAVLPLV